MTRSETLTLRCWIESLPRDGRLDLASSAELLKPVSPLHPVNLADLIGAGNTWLRWHDVAAEVMRRVLERPDAIRIWPGVDTDAWLRQLGGAGPAIASASELRARPIDLDFAHVAALYRLSTAPLEWVVACGPSRLSSPLGMAIVKVRRALSSTLLTS